MSIVNDDVRFQRCTDLIQAEVDGGLVGLHIENGQCYGFNSTASRIWELLSEPKSVAELCVELSQEFEIDAGGCAQEVSGLIAELKENGLVSEK